MIKQLAEETVRQVQALPSGTCNMETYNLVFAGKIIDKCIELALINDDTLTAIDINDYFKDKE